MKCFWMKEEHYNLFENKEIVLYDIDKYILDYKLVGLIGWDDFILAKEDKFYKIPTVPLDLKYLEELKEIESFNFTDGKGVEKSDYNKIKWYITPLIFGGKPDDNTNIVWVDLKDHSKLVSYWNKMYYENKKS